MDELTGLNGLTGERAVWRETGQGRFPAALRAGGAWCVLRLNGFPDHPMWTLFVGGVPLCDLDSTPASLRSPASRAAPPLDADEAWEAVAPISGFAAYGSERGDPCDGPWCCD
ncbi:hypothetical protein AB0I28_11270 [Phytomonospora sp. NPDC050363]|uniref:hypothetical protein n=1 Tax=Phytomonospora sp. NPDC050363 TaxID=3155642 RepID=UPI0033D4490F